MINNIVTLTNTWFHQSSTSPYGSCPEPDSKYEWPCYVADPAKEDRSHKLRKVESFLIILNLSVMPCTSQDNIELLMSVW